MEKAAQTFDLHLLTRLAANGIPLCANCFNISKTVIGVL